MLTILFSKEHVNMKKIFLLFILLACAGCSNNAHLSVQTLYFTRESLASYYAETPDPMLINPPVGQKLLVSWAVPRYFMDYEDLHLNIRIRFRNRKEVELNIPVERACGSYMYVVANEYFFETNGILTYKVDLIGGGALLEEWRHQLWHELIQIGEEQDPQDAGVSTSTRNEQTG